MKIAGDQSSCNWTLCKPSFVRHVINYTLLIEVWSINRISLRIATLVNPLEAESKYYRILHYATHVAMQHCRWIEGMS